MELAYNKVKFSLKKGPKQLAYDNMLNKLSTTQL